MVERVDVTEVGFGVLADLAGRSIVESGLDSGLHPGDIAHARVGALRAYDPSEVFPVWAVDGDPVAFGLVWPMHPSADLVIPDHLDDPTFEAIVDDAVRFVRGATNEATITVEPAQRRLDAALDRRGFGPSKDEYMITEQLLGDLPAVPEISYEIRGAALDDVEGIAAAHRSAFGSTWTPDEYQTYMTTPPYLPEREVIAVAPDGTVAGFAVVWIDPISKVGYFEPVGVHKDHTRRGVGTAVLTAGLHLMRSAGMERGCVLYELDSENEPFYTSVGFTAVGVVRSRSRTWEDPTT